jgi:hypothetical protein
MKRVCTRLISMNQSIRKRFIGVDLKGRSISGLILHVGNYDKQQNPVNYVVQTDTGGRAIVAASVIQNHLRDLELVAAMDAGNE